MNGTTSGPISRLVRPCRALWAFAVIVASVGCAGVSPETTTLFLEVYSPQQGSVLLRREVAAGDTFSLEYLHSVSKSPVTGTFEVTETARITPLTTKFRAFGPGLPWPSEGDRHVIEDNAILVFHDEPDRDELRIWISPATEDTLLLGHERVKMSDWSSDTLLVVIRVARD